LESSFWTTYPFVAYSEAALNGVALALSLWTTVLFFKESKSFPIFFIYNSIASVTASAADHRRRRDVSHAGEPAAGLPRGNCRQGRYADACLYTLATGVGRLESSVDLSQ